MRRSRERVHSHRKGAGPEREDAQPDADRKWSIENEPEDGKENAQLQTRLGGKTDDPPESSTYPRYDIARSDYHESYVKDREPLEPEKPEEAGLEWPQGNTNPFELQSDSDSVWTNSSTSDTDKTERNSAIDPKSVSHLIPDQIGNLIFDRTRNVWLKRERQDAEDAGDDPFADIPDLPVDDIKELQMRRLRREKTQYPKLARWEDKMPTVNSLQMRRLSNGKIQDLKLARWAKKSPTNSLQRLGSGKHGSTEDVEQARLKELYHRSKFNFLYYV